MKKHWIRFVLLGMVLLGLVGRVSAYEPHSMPGGKNYLASDNFPIDMYGAETLDHIMVKPNMFYTLAVKTYYNDEGGIVEIGQLINGVPHSLLYFEGSDFESTFDPQFKAVTFKTPPTVNYVSIRFYHGGDYFNDGDPGDFQLEEGTLFTGYEPYAGPSIYDTTGPAFVGSSVILVNVDHPITVSEILESFTAYDAVSGDVTASIEVITDSYSTNQNVVGTYSMSIRAFDQAGNHTTASFSVRVVDVTKPALTGPSEIIVPYPNTKTTESILAEYYVSDNYDPPGTLIISVVSNAYAGHEHLLGDYALVLRAVDASGNETVKSVTIRVQDRAEPVITGPSTISIGYHLTYSESEILALYTAQDDHDGDISEQLVLTANPYALTPTVLGNYLLWIEIADSAGNETAKPVNIHVVDLIGPIVYYDTSVLTVYNNTHLLLSDITKLLIASSVLGNRDYRATVLFDSYTKSARIPGVYHMEIEYASEGMEVSLQTLKIVVKQAAGDFIPGEPLRPGTPALSFWERNWGWFGSGFFLFATVASNLVWWKLKRRK